MFRTNFQTTPLPQEGSSENKNQGTSQPCPSSAPSFGASRQQAKPNGAGCPS
ncbi:hypothetical protein HMPREF3156_01532 [Neisseria sp. HMSC06F02]|nr:hypothetical protein HMPREF3156_01532 [Neisseria sp. HMSC06F02]